jgi:parallel beta-helix repeat protein
LRLSRAGSHVVRVIVAALAVGALAAPATPAVSETTATAIEDAYVDASAPTSNFGSVTRLKTDGSPRITIYLKFDVSGYTAGSSAALRVYSTSDSDTPFEVRTVADTSWSESTINAQNAPPVGDVLAASGPVTANTWQTLDVSGAVTRDGVVAFALTTASSTATFIHSSENTNAPQLAIPGMTEPSPFVVRRSAPDSSVYTAESTSAALLYTGTLKSVVESAVNDLSRAGGGVVHFGAGVFDLGNSQLELKDMVGVTFEGEGIDVTTISNSRSVSADTEVFDVARATRGGIRDLTVSAGGPARSTSDAIDFDAGNHQVIERVKVSKSRSRGIVFDGKDVMGGIARGAANNVVRNCVIMNMPGDGIELLAASNNRIDGCTITNVGGHGIQAAKASSSAGVPNGQPNNNVIVGNFIDQSGQDGINITSGDANEVVANTVLNSANRVRDRDGIKIASDNSIRCDDNVVSGNTATDNQSTKTQRYGLAIVSSLCTATVVVGNNFAGNRVGEILDDGTATTYGEPTPDADAPSVPGDLTATASAPTHVDLTWSAATDNVAVTGYTIYRDGVALATVGPATPSYQDRSASPNTTYSYAVDAFDAAGNHSGTSAPASATTPEAPPGPAVETFVPRDDAQVTESSPTTNYGTQTTLRVDASPVTRSYLKFDVTGITGAISSARLRVHANSSSAAGFHVHGAGDTTWSESTLTYSNAPPFGAAAGSSGSFASGVYAGVDVTSLVTGNGTYTFVLSTSSTTAVSLASKESTEQPQLVLEFTADQEPPAPDAEAPTSPTGLSATAVDSSHVDLQWNAAADNVAVSGYTVYRDGVALATVGGSTTTYADTSVSANTSYAYTVDAFDAAANHSAPSSPASVTTPEPPPPPTVFTFTPSDDAQVSASLPATNYGEHTTIRLDGSPVLRGYLKFAISGISGTVSRVKLRLHANSSSNTGFHVHAAADTAWTESTITYENAPAFDAAVTSSGAFASGAYVELDVTSLIAGDGTYTLVLTATGETGLSLASSETTNAPQLVIETAP